MIRFVDDLAGALKGIFHYVAYFLAGIILVSVPLYAIVLIFNWFE